MKSLLAFLILLTSIPLIAQNHFIGVQGGAAWTDVNGENFIPDNYARKGLMTGLKYEYQFKNNLQLGLDVLYNQKGFKSDILFTDNNGVAISKGEIDFKFDYLSLPIKAGYTIGNDFKGFFNVAAVPSFLLRSEIENSLFDANNNLEDISDKFTKFDLAGMLELGGSYSLREQILLFMAFNYQYSFTSYTSDDEFFPVSEAYHYGFTAAIGIKYKFIKE
ncbi:MAG: porin family protein [Vicingaceae bacterium]